MIVAGVVTGWSGKTVTVRLNNGRTVTARANGRSYVGIGTTVYVAIDDKNNERAVIV